MMCGKTRKAFMQTKQPSSELSISEVRIFGSSHPVARIDRLSDPDAPAYLDKSCV
jgi:hypothetical protein